MTHKIIFTELTDNQGEIIKKISINKHTGKLKKDGEAKIWDGYAESKELLFSDLSAYFQNLPPEKAIALGTTEYAPAKIVITPQQDPPHSIGRNKANFSFYDAANWSLIDAL